MHASRDGFDDPLHATRDGFDDPSYDGLSDELENFITFATSHSSFMSFMSGNTRRFKE